MKIEESFSSGIAYQYSAVAAMFLSSTFFYFLVAHLLPPSVVGAISLIYGIISIAGILFILGFTEGLEHFISYHLSRNSYRNIIHIIRVITLFSAISALIAYFIIYLTAPYIAIILFHSKSYSLFLRLAGIAISGFIVMNIFSSILLGLKQYVKYSKAYLIANILIYAIPIGMLLIFHSVIDLVTGISIAYFINATIFILYDFNIYNKIKIYKGNEKIESLTAFIAYSFPLFLSAVLGTGSRYVDRIVVAYFIDLKDLGIYNFALILSSVALVLVMPISNLIMPKFSSDFSLNNMKGLRSNIKTILNLEYFIYIPAAIGIAAISKITLFIFAGSAYTLASLPLIIILFSSSFFVGSSVLGISVKSVRKSRIFILSSLAALISNILLSIILIPLYGIIGAAIAYSSMSAVNFVITYFAARRLKISNFDVIRIAKIWIASLIMFALIFFMQSLFPYNIEFEMAYIFTGIAVFALETRVFKLLGKNETKLIISIIPDKFQRLKNAVLHLSGYNNRL